MDMQRSCCQAGLFMHESRASCASTALSSLLASQVAVSLGVDVRMLTAFPTARALTRHMQQAATNWRNDGNFTGKVRTALTVT